MINIKLKRLPIFFALALILTLGFPAIIFQYFDTPFLANNSMLANQAFLSSTQFQNCLEDIIVKWLALSLASLTLLLTYTQYRFTRKKYTLMIGLGQLIVAGLVMRDLSTNISEAHTAVYFFKIMLYFAPFFLLMTNIITTYGSVLEKHMSLQVNQDKLQYIAAHDGLTGLYNRGQFEEFLHKAIAQSSRFGETFGLFIIDIDNFKAINDIQGHIQGDQVIQTFATELEKVTRQGDILARLGGDEFALITTKLHSATSAQNLAERIINGIHIQDPINPKQMLTYSMGIAIYPVDAENSHDLIMHADSAMYQAKRAGKNTYHFYAEKSQAISPAREEFST